MKAVILFWTLQTTAKKHEVAIVIESEKMFFDPGKCSYFNTSWNLLTDCI